jgi:hypothetical protein
VDSQSVSNTIFDVDFIYGCILIASEMKKKKKRV